MCLFGLYRVWNIQHTLNVLGSDTMGAFIGPANAKNTVVEFMDYRCSYCRAFDPTMKEFARQHPDVKIVFRHFPLYDEPSIHESAIALAAAKQGKFLAMHDYLIAQEGPLQDADLPAIAQKLGLDAARLQKDMKDKTIGRQLLTTLAATGTLNIDRAPSFIFNKTVYVPQNGPPDLSGFDKLYRQYQRP